MTKNPIINALAASLYITIVASIMNYGRKLTGQPDSVVVPMAVLSLFVLSAAVMGLLFLFQPTQLYLGGEKKKAVNLFLSTIAVFAFITALVFTALFSKVLQ